MNTVETSPGDNIPQDTNSSEVAASQENVWTRGIKTPPDLRPLLGDVVWTESEVRNLFQFKKPALSENSNPLDNLETDQAAPPIEPTI